MSWEVIFDPKAHGSLKDYDKGKREKILKAIRKLEDNPKHFGKPLTGIDLWVLRAGDYRVIFDLNRDKKQVEILKIGHRRNIYDNL